MAYDEETLLRRDALKTESDQAIAANKAQGEIETKRVEGDQKLKLQRELVAVKSQEAMDASLGAVGRSYRASKDKAFDPGMVADKSQQLAATGDVRGFEGVQNPVHIIRRMKSTYAGGAPGEEFSTATGAMQGINRYYGIGDYVSPEVAKDEALALKDPKKVAEAKMAEHGLRLSQFTEAFGRTDESGKKALHPEASSMLHRAIISGEDVSKPEFLGKFDALHKDINEADALNNPKNKVTARDSMVQGFKNLPPDDKAALLKETGRTEKEAIDFLKTGTADLKNLPLFRKLGGGVAAEAVTRPGTTAAPGAVPAAVAPPAPVVGSAEEAVSLGITRPSAAAPAAAPATAAPGVNWEETINNPLPAAARAIRAGAATADKVWDPIARAWIAGAQGVKQAVTSMGPEGMSNPTGMPLEMSPGAVEAAQQHQLGLEMLRAQSKQPQQWTTRERELMWAQSRGNPSAMGGFTNLVRPSGM